MDEETEVWKNKSPTVTQLREARTGTQNSGFRARGESGLGKIIFSFLIYIWFSLHECFRDIFSE